MLSLSLCADANARVRLAYSGENISDSSCVLWISSGCVNFSFSVSFLSSAFTARPLTKMVITQSDVIATVIDKDVFESARVSHATSRTRDDVPCYGCWFSFTSHQTDKTLLIASKFSCKYFPTGFYIDFPRKFVCLWRDRGKACACLHKFHRDEACNCWLTCI